MSWLNKLLPPKIKRNESGIARKSTLPEGLWSNARPVKRCFMPLISTTI